MLSDGWRRGAVFWIGFGITANAKDNKNQGDQRDRPHYTFRRLVYFAKWHPRQDP